MCNGHLDKFLRRKAVVLLAFLVTVSTCVFQDNVSLISTVRYFAFLVCPVLAMDGVLGINRFPLLGDPNYLAVGWVK